MAFNQSNPSRKDEVLNWINLNPSKEDFIILDDDTSLHALLAEIKEKLILTSRKVGLTDYHLEDIVKKIDLKIQTVYLPNRDIANTVQRFLRG